MYQADAQIPAMKGNYTDAYPIMMVLIRGRAGEHGITAALNALETLRMVRDAQWIQPNQCFSDSLDCLRFIKITLMRYGLCTLDDSKNG